MPQKFGDNISYVKVQCVKKVMKKKDAVKERIST